MKIILTSSSPRLGKIGDVVAVANGYAKNFLIPRKLAICFTEANYRVFAERRSHFEEENSQKLALAQQVKAKIQGKEIILIQNASDDGRLYGSVNSSLIASRINEIAGDRLISRNQVQLKKPIREIGLYEAEISLHADLSCPLRLIVTRSESEVEIIKNLASKTSSKAAAEAAEASAA